jgi:hypothetical protein
MIKRIILNLERNESRGYAITVARTFDAASSADMSAITSGEILPTFVPTR